MSNPLPTGIVRALLTVSVLLALLALTACEKARPTPPPTFTPTVEAPAVLQQVAVPKIDLSVALAGVVEGITDLDSLLVDMAGLERLALEEQVPVVPEY
ncbi:MAG: hypothetical protein HW388_553 [Dehalococcoidia bacterium]|nr:hypothetical protein [Dehalococcoidia bacterium]